MRESDEDVESEIERSIFNIAMSTRVGREDLHYYLDLITSTACS